MTPLNRFGMLYEVSKPVLGVFGTSSKQGKFTLQLELRIRLQQLGYKVGQIGTEPQSLLFGFDSVFPIGYNSTVHMSPESMILYLNNIINELCEKSDIIIVGAQSGTVPYNSLNISRIPIKQISYLYATQPDAVVLCVNPYDPYDYVKRTIGFIESGANCKVLGLVVFPMTIMEEWSLGYVPKYKMNEKERNELKDNLQAYFNIPVFHLDDTEDICNLTKHIIDYFCD